jgi:peptidoglycan LD-endopeptidase LytH
MRTTPHWDWIWTGLAGFAAGVVAMTLLVQTFPQVVIPASSIVTPTPLERVPQTREPILRPGPAVSACPPIQRAVARERHTPPPSAAALADLRIRRLELPVEGFDRRTLRSSFREERGSSREHEAIDLLAPRNTPVHAVESGCVAKLFFSDNGGHTIYQFDPSATYAYYYAHLERYADDLAEGSPVERGQVIGYVGTSGNAPDDVPHLHFAIFVLTADRRWWQGAPIDPYEVWQ